MNDNKTHTGAEATAPHVYTAINQVQSVMAKEGIAKTRRNTQGSGYNFRGVDDVMNALAGHLAEAKLMILPRAITKECAERESKSGGALFYTTIKMEFDFVSAVDGSKHTVCMFGEAMDSGDKSSNKAASAAFKYACFQAFCIPTESDNDADAHTHEVATKAAKPLSPETEKHLRFLAETPKGKALIERVLTEKRLVGVDDMDEDMGKSCIKWVESKLKKEEEPKKEAA